MVVVVVYCLKYIYCYKQRHFYLNLSISLARISRGFESSAVRHQASRLYIDIDCVSVTFSLITQFQCKASTIFQIYRPYLYIYMGQPLQKQVFLAVGLAETFADEPVSHCTQSPNIGLSDLMHGLRIYLFSTDQTFTHQGSTKVSHCCLGDIN